MTVSVQWDNEEQTTVHYLVSGRWTWDEFYAALTTARHMIAESQHQHVHAIIDISEGSLFPKNALLHLRRLASDTPDKMQSATMVIVSGNLFVKSLMDVMRHLSPGTTQHFHLVKTLDEARSVIANEQTVTAV